MPVRSATVGMLAIAGCCLLQPGQQLARATPLPSPEPHSHKPVASDTAAVALPVFQPGLWQYRRTVMNNDSPRPQVSMLRKCADPTTEIREKMAQLESRSCRFAPFSLRYGRYYSSWTCPTPEGPTRFRAVLIVRGAAGYTDLSEMHSTQHRARQTIEAQRIGECPASRPLPPRNPNLKPTPHGELRG